MGIRDKIIWGFEFQEPDGTDKLAAGWNGGNDNWYLDDTPDNTNYNRENTDSPIGSSYYSEGQDWGVPAESTQPVFNTGSESDAMSDAGLGDPISGAGKGFAVEILIHFPVGNTVGDAIQWNAVPNTRHYINKFQSLKSQFYVYDGGGTQRTLQEGTGMTQGQWVHYVTTVEAGTSGEWKIYRDGTATASATWTYGDIEGLTGLSYLQVGSRNAGAAGRRMRFCRWYNEPLTSTDVTTLYNSGAYRDKDYFYPLPFVPRFNGSGCIGGQ